MIGDDLDFTTIEAVDRVRRLPRVGKLALGIKKKSQKGSEYPSEVDYFVPRPDGFEGPQGAAVREKFVSIYGEHPKALDVVFPTENIAEFFPFSFKHYGAGAGLKCIGNGVEAKQLGSLSGKTGDAANEFFVVECPNEECPFYVEKKCRRVARLTFMLPRVTMAGYFQIDTSSWNSRVDVCSDLDMIRSLFGRIANLVNMAGEEPATVLLLSREPRETAHGGKKRVHWTMRVRVRNQHELDLKALKAIRLARTGAGLLPALQPDALDVPVDLYPKSQLAGIPETDHVPANAQTNPEAAQGPETEQAEQPAAEPAHDAEPATPEALPGQYECECGAVFDPDAFPGCPECGQTLGSPQQKRAGPGAATESKPKAAAKDKTTSKSQSDLW